jgi:hypothetical protein
MNQDSDENMIDEQEDTETLATAEQSNILVNVNKYKKKIQKKGVFNGESLKDGLA